MEKTLGIIAVSKTASKNIVLVRLSEKQAEAALAFGYTYSDFPKELMKTILSYFPDAQDKISSTVFYRLVYILSQILRPPKKTLFRRSTEDSKISYFNYSNTSSIYTTIILKYTFSSRILKVTYIVNDLVVGGEIKGIPKKYQQVDSPAEPVQSELEEKVRSSLVSIQQNVSKLSITGLSVEQQHNLESLAAACRQVENLLSEANYFENKENKEEIFLTAQTSLAQITESLSAIENELTADIIREMKVLQIYLDMRNSRFSLE